MHADERLPTMKLAETWRTECATRVGQGQCMSLARAGPNNRGATRATGLPQAAPNELVQTKQTTVNAPKTIPKQLHCLIALNRRAASFG